MSEKNYRTFIDESELRASQNEEGVIENNLTADEQTDPLSLVPVLPDFKFDKNEKNPLKPEYFQGLIKEGADPVEVSVIRGKVGLAALGGIHELSTGSDEQKKLAQALLKLYHNPLPQKTDNEAKIKAATEAAKFVIFSALPPEVKATVLQSLTDLENAIVSRLLPDLKGPAKPEVRLIAQNIIANLMSTQDSTTTDIQERYFIKYGKEIMRVLIRGGSDLPSRSEEMGTAIAETSTKLRELIKIETPKASRAQAA